MEKVVGDPFIITHTNRVSIDTSELNNSVGSHTVSVNGEVVGDPVDVNYEEKLVLASSDIVSGIHTVYVDAEVVGDNIPVRHLKKLSLSSESSITSGPINISINGDTIADPPGVPFIKKLEFINSIVLDNYTFSIDGEIVGDPVDIRIKKDYQYLKVTYHMVLLRYQLMEKYWVIL